MPGGPEQSGVDGPLRIERFDDRVVATLNRPDRKNAIDQATIDALHVLCAELEAIPRILILTGAGGVFASGADIAELRERRADDARRGINASAFIRALVGDRSREAAERVRGLYGGSVKPDHAAEILAQRDVDGALVGGASLDPERIARIAAAAAPLPAS